MQLGLDTCVSFLLRVLSPIDHVLAGGWCVKIKWYLPVRAVFRRDFPFLPAVAASRANVRAKQLDQGADTILSMHAQPTRQRLMYDTHHCFLSNIRTGGSLFPPSGRDPLPAGSALGHYQERRVWTI